jgi:hypothetical protein
LFFSFPELAEKFLQQRGARGSENSTGDRRSVVEPIVFAESIERLNGARFRIQTTKDQPAYTRLQYRAHAHDAGFQSNINIAIVEPPRAQRGRGFLDRADFGMAERALSSLPLIKPAAHDSIAQNDHRPDRHFSLVRRLSGLRQGEIHVVAVGAVVRKDQIGHSRKRR